MSHTSWKEINEQHRVLLNYISRDWFEEFEENLNNEISINIEHISKDANQSSIDENSNVLSPAHSYASSLRNENKSYTSSEFGTELNLASEFNESFSLEKRDLNKPILNGQFNTILNYNTNVEAPKTTRSLKDFPTHASINQFHPKYKSHSPKATYENKLLEDTVNQILHSTFHSSSPTHYEPDNKIEKNVDMDIFSSPILNANNEAYPPSLNEHQTNRNNFKVSNILSSIEHSVGFQKESTPLEDEHNNSNNILDSDFINDVTKANQQQNTFNVIHKPNDLDNNFNLNENIIVKSNNYILESNSQKLFASIWNDNIHLPQGNKNQLNELLVKADNKKAKKDNITRIKYFINWQIRRNNLLEQKNTLWIFKKVKIKKILLFWRHVALESRKRRIRRIEEDKQKRDEMEFRNLKLASENVPLNMTHIEPNPKQTMNNNHFELNRQNLIPNDPSVDDISMSMNQLSFNKDSSLYKGSTYLTDDEANIRDNIIKKDMILKNQQEQKLNNYLHNKNNQLIKDSFQQWKLKFINSLKIKQVADNRVRFIALEKWKDYFKTYPPYQQFSSQYYKSCLLKKFINAVDTCYQSKKMNYYVHSKVNKNLKVKTFEFIKQWVPQVQIGNQIYFDYINNKLYNIKEDGVQYNLLKKAFLIWKENLEDNKLRKRMEKLDNQVIRVNNFVPRGRDRLNSINESTIKKNYNGFNQSLKLDTYIGDDVDWRDEANKLADEFRIHSLIERAFKHWNKKTRDHLIFNQIIKDPVKAVPFLRKLEKQEFTSIYGKLIAINNKSIDVVRKELFQYRMQKPISVKKNVLNGWINYFKVYKEGKKKAEEQAIKSFKKKFFLIWKKKLQDKKLDKLFDDKLNSNKQLSLLNKQDTKKYCMSKVFTIWRKQSIQFITLDNTSLQLRQRYLKNNHLQIWKDALKQKKVNRKLKLLKADAIAKQSATQRVFILWYNYAKDFKQ